MASQEVQEVQEVVLCPTYGPKASSLPILKAGCSSYFTPPVCHVPTLPDLPRQKSCCVSGQKLVSQRHQHVIVGDCWRSLPPKPFDIIHVRFTKRRPSAAKPMAFAKRQETAESVLSLCCSSASTERFDDKAPPRIE